MQLERGSIDLASVTAAGLGVLLTALLSTSFAEAVLVFLFSAINILGVRVGARYGSWITWGFFLVSGIVLQRNQMRYPLIGVCLLLSAIGTQISDRLGPPRSRVSNNFNESENQLFPPELLQLLFGSSASSSSSSAKLYPDRRWLSSALHSVIQQVAPVRIPQFDIGGRLPLFSTQSYREMSVSEVREGIIREAPSQAEQLCAIKKSPNDKSKGGAQPPSLGPTRGFEMLVDFSYASDENTKIEVEIPMKVPIWGDLTVPVMVAAPELAGRVNVEFRHDVIEFEEGSGNWQKVMALGIMFEPIREIHIHSIHISLASQFQLIQYIPMVKNYMKEAVNYALAPKRRRVLIFDSDFSSIASTVLGEFDMWNIPGILEHAKKEKEAAERGEKLENSGLSSCPEMRPSSSSQGPQDGSKNIKEASQPYPVLDLSDGKASVPVMPSRLSPASAQDHSASSPDLATLTDEVNTDVPVGLQPGPVRERDPSEPGIYPKLEL